MEPAAPSWARTVEVFREEERALPWVPGANQSDEVLVRSREDIEPPVVRINPRAGVMESSAADAGLLENRSQTIQIRMILLNELDVEAGGLLSRDASFRIEVSSRKSKLPGFVPRLSRAIGSPRRFDRPHSTTALAVYPSALPELLEQDLENA